VRVVLSRQTPPGVALALVAAWIAVGSAQRGNAPDGAAPAAKPYVPLATTVLAKDPDKYIGKNVTLTATVARVLTKSAFSIDQRGKNGATGHDVLVLAPILNGPVEAGKFVTVAGELVTFDPAAIAAKVKDYRLDLPSDLVDRYRGRPVVIAKVVVNDAMVDLAMRLPPPMSADEKALDDTMKRVGAAFAALRTGVDASNASATAPSVAVLKQAFAQTESFWKAKGVDRAAILAHEAGTRVDAIEKASAGGDWDAAKKTVATLNQSCQSCHASYRERFDDGSFRVKPGR
jgi:cytochrome c556